MRVLDIGQIRGIADASYLMAYGSNTAQGGISCLSLWHKVALYRSFLCMEATITYTKRQREIKKYT